MCPAAFPAGAAPGVAQIFPIFFFILFFFHPGCSAGLAEVAVGAVTCPLSLHTDRNVESTEDRLWLGERKMKNISSSPPRENLIYYQLPRDSPGLVSEMKGNGEV